MERIETGVWGWAIFGLALAYVFGLILLGQVAPFWWLLAIGAKR